MEDVSDRRKRLKMMRDEADDAVDTDAGEILSQFVCLLRKQCLLTPQQYLQVPVSGPGTSAGSAVLANPLTDQEDSTPVPKAFSFYRYAKTCTAGSTSTRSCKV